MVVYVETDFILEMGYQQAESEFCERIVELAENDQIVLTIPSFSIGESYETSYRREKERKSFADDLDRRRSQLSYSSDRDTLARHIQTVIETLLESIDQDNRRLSRVLSRLTTSAEFISLSRSSLAMAQQFQNDMQMVPPDSLVLSSVVAHLSETGPDECCFLNKNSKDFGTTTVRNELNAYDCRLISSFEQGLNYISSTLGS